MALQSFSKVEVKQRYWKGNFEAPSSLIQHSVTPWDVETPENDPWIEDESSEVGNLQDEIE